MQVPPELNSKTASYQPLCTLASGGMGRVDLAVRKEGSFERLFAVKRLKPELAEEAGVRAMFLDEARIAGLIRHPNAVSVVDVGEDESGPFLIMPYVDGITVAELIGARKGELIPMEVALKIVIHAAEGLHAAHELVGPDGAALELVHRDVSPQNIMVGFDGVSLVTDFGVAKALGRTTKTSTGVLKGKLGYLAPEQLRFEEPDRRADLFALGVVLFELLSGCRLYKNGDGLEGPRRILNEPPPDLTDYRDDAEPELVELMFELLAKQREKRPSDAKKVARRLDAILASVVATGQSVDVADYLATHFSHKRAAMQAHIKQARSRSSGGAVTLETLSAVAKPARGRRLSLISLVLVAGLLGVLGLALSRKSPVETARAEVAPVAVATAHAKASSSALAPVPTATVQATPGPEPARVTTAVRSKQTTPRPKPSAQKPSVPMWESY